MKIIRLSLDEDFINVPKEGALVITKDVYIEIDTVSHVYDMNGKRLEWGPQQPNPCMVLVEEVPLNCMFRFGYHAVDQPGFLI